MSNSKRWTLSILSAILLFALAAFIHLLIRDPLAGVIGKYQRDGEPITPADFDSPAPPDDQNAAVAIKEATEKLHLSDDDEIWLGDADFSKPLSSDNLARGEKIIAAQADALASLHDAATRPAIRWPEPVIAPVTAYMNTGMSRLNTARHLANVLRLAAIVHHQQGDDRAAAQNVCDILTLAHIAGHDGPLIAHLVDIGINALGCAAAHRLIPDLHVNAASRAAITQLISRLLDDNARKADVLRTWQCERAFVLENVRVQSQSSFGTGLVYGSGTPYLMDAVDRARTAALMPDFPAATAYLAKTRPSPPSRFSFGQNLATPMMQSTDRHILTDFRVLTDRRLTATALAIALYRADHAGRFPATLDDLVPNDLPHIPADPFVANAQPLHYRPAAPSIVYSVGENGTDEGGDATPKNPAEPDAWSAPDYVIPLTPPSDQPPTPHTSPSTRPL